jgi:phosphoglycerate-specific signal transduction histidine kinase
MKILFDLFFYLLTSQEVLAYVDPGSGSLLLQFILAGLVGIGVFFKNIRLWIVQFFRKKDNNSNS